MVTRRPSDLSRPWTYLWAAIAVTLAFSAALAGMRMLGPSPAPLGAPGPLARPHVQAQVPCVGCHVESGKSPSCNGCHRTEEHVSRRPAHARLQAKGELTCAMCHPAHGDAAGITFGKGEAIVFSGRDELRVPSPAHAPTGQTVALPRAHACAKCHNTASPKDPFARCGTNDAGVITSCLEEHEDISGERTRGASGPCARAHGPTRHVAWTVAAGLGASQRWPEPAERRPLLPGALGLGALAGLFALWLLRPRQATLTATGNIAAGAAVGKDAPIAAPGAERRKALPVINASTCVGCRACVDACPMDVFEVRHFVAVVARPSQCCGLLLCAQVCPNGSVHVDTTADDVGAPQPTTPAPVPGVFFAGDITGVPLIRNAVVQGERAAANAHARARSLGARDSSVVDVAILGAGPAGLAAALHAKRLGMTYAVLEQDAFAASIRSFPRSKLVLGAAELGPTADAQLLVGDSSKEELLARWTQTVRKERLQIEEHQRVTRVAKRDETFVVTSVGAEGEARTTSARSVIVAVGRRGSPRKLHAPIDDNMRSQVSYALVDAQAFAQQRVLVVGLGDAALEAIVALARQPGTSVTVVHRGTGLERGRQRNIDAVRRLLEQGVVRAFFSAKVERIGDGVAELVVAEQTVRVAVDRVLVLIGGEANLGLLMPLGEAGIPAPDAPPA